MENDNISPDLCINGCGFYSNAVYNNMCSRCFKESQKKSQPNNLDSEPLNTTSISLPQLPTIKTETLTLPEKIEPVSNPLPDIGRTTLTDVPHIQLNKSRCFLCRGKVALAKQTINKCRCGFVYCDEHRFQENHGCTVDIVKHDKEILSKNNPKLHNKPKGGRSFLRTE